MITDLLPELPRAWRFPSLGGYREGDGIGTYFSFPLKDLPPIQRTLDARLEWLRSEPEVKGSLRDRDPGDPEPVRPATARDLEALVRGTGVATPEPFETFIGTPELQARVRSVTACYLDLADEVVELSDGGQAIHFLSDQQWVLHWLLVLGDDGSEAVVATEEPLGFLDRDPGDEATAAWPETATVCSGSFNEFLYRFWLENEAWRGIRTGQLTDEQRSYLDHYRPT